ncbi:ABC transporter substrate-binding protein [Pontibacter sp. JH31]|uniref:ABC transporter substrate-binding protein n=1 Tax=Pontibacter aquaedesilientis TaxID=2766980 RepID=A0ABR7XC58_9BACT|nr:ABC transporter substrate-binding protein [Pontibacter aquaedesilientis]
MAADISSLNPVSYSELEALQIINLLYNSLLTTDLADNTLKPGLASSMPQVERNDSLTLFTYQIREEAEWANGSPVTGADVAFTLKVLKAPFINNENLSPQVEFIRDIVLNKSNPRQFTVVCTGYTPEMELLTGDFFILPAYLLDPEGLFAGIALPSLADSSIVLRNKGRIQSLADRLNRMGSPGSTELLSGSAGYTLERWAKGQYVTVKRKDNWWGNTTGADGRHLAANPARISFQVIPENTTALLALKNRQLDVLDNIPVTEFVQLNQDKVFLKDYELFSPQGFSLVYAGLNTRTPKLKDKRTRQAIAHLLDVENLIKATQQSYATPTVGPIPPSVKKFYHQNLAPYTFSEQKAMALLKSAGWIKEQNGWFRQLNGKKEQLTLEIIYIAGNTVYEQSALIFQQHAAKAGIPVTVQALESNYFNQKINGRDFDMFFRGISGNPFVFNFKPLFHSTYAGPGGFNTTGFGTPESDALLDAINTAETEADKARLLKKLQAILHEEAAFVSLYYRKEKLAIHRRFSNTKVSGLSPYYDVSSFMLKK